MVRLCAFAAFVFLQGCCCCCGGGGGSGGSFSFTDDISDRVSDQVERRATEMVFEQLGDLDGVELNPDEGRFSISGPDGDLVIEASEEDGTFRFAGGDEFVLEGGQADEVPEDFPLTAYPGATPTGVVRTSEGGVSAWVVALETSDAPENVVTFYEQELASLGTVEKQAFQEEGQQMVHLLVDDVTVMVMAEGGQTAIMLMVSQQT